MGSINQRNLGITLILIAIMLSAVGEYYFPTDAITQCNNGSCVTTTPGLISYAVAGGGSVAFLVGVLLVYLAWRRNRTPMYP